MKKYTAPITRIAVFALAVLLTAPLFSAPSLAGTGGSYGLEFLKLYGGSRPLAMGEAYTAVADDTSSIIFNPAGLNFVNAFQIQAMSNQWFSGISQRMALAAFPIGFGVLGIGYTDLNSGDILGYSNTGTAEAVFSTASNAVIVSYASKFREDLFYGVSIKGISEKLESFTGSSFGADLGIKYIMNSDLHLGASVLNLGPGLRFDQETTPLPITIRGGASYNAKVFEKDLKLAADVVLYSDSNKFNLGAEYKPHEILALRAGLYGRNLRAGAGLTTKPVVIDYSFAPDANLGATHQISLTFFLQGEDPIKKSIVENLAQAKAYYKASDYSNAIVKYERVLQLEPLNEEAKSGLVKSQQELNLTTYRFIALRQKTEMEEFTKEMLQKGKAFMGQGRYSDAVIVYSEILKVDPTNMEVLRQQDQARARLQERLNTKNKLESKEDVAEAMKHISLSQFEAAREKLASALSKDPENRQAIDLMSKIKFLEKN